MKSFYLILMVLVPCLSYNQVSFKDYSDELLGKNITFNSYALGISDLNGDLRDDIVGLDKNNNLIIFYQNNVGEKFTQIESTITLTKSPLSIMIGDLDHDGTQELIICLTGTVIIAKVDDQGVFHVDQTFQPDFYYPQGANLIDVIGNGNLDLFICNDIAASNIFSPNSEGHYEVNNEYQFITIPESDNSGNYGSVWTDIDNDNDLDLYIVKCSVHAPDDSTDPRRINQLFINEGGVFTENKDLNLSDGDQSWSVDAADIDNDGDIDIFYTNHNGPHTLMINEGDTFRKSDFVFDASGSYQNILEDFDNNGFVDILISSGTDDVIYYNYGNEVFVKSRIYFLGSTMSSVSVGDFNSDGFLDIYGSSGGVSGSGNLSDRLNINLGNENNYVYFQLEGTMSNTNAIGAKVKIYTADSIQVREVKSGIGYGITKSQKLHFGLGTIESIDSVEVIWPTGIIDRFEIDQINSTYMVTEGSCISRIDFGIDNIYECPDNRIELSITDADKVSWNFGYDSTHFQVEDSGYNFAVVERNGCKTVERFVNVVYENVDEPILKAVRVDFCDNGFLELETNYQGDYLWSTGDTSPSIVVDEAGQYRIDFIDLCGDVYSDSIVVEAVNTNVLAPKKVTIYDDSLLVFQIPGSEVLWYNDTLNAPFFVGNIYEHYYTEDTTTFFIQRTEEEYSDLSTVGLDIAEANATNANTVSSGIYFDLEKDVVIETIDINAFTLGQRRIVIYNNKDEAVFVKDVFPQEGVNTISLDVFLPKGENYYLTTDADINIAVQGYRYPELGCSYTNLDYPYIYENGVKLDYTSNGRSIYPYFFNWKVKELIYDCSSDYHILEVVKDIETGVTDINEEYSLYPNPSSGMFYLDTNLELTQVEIYNMQGQAISFNQDNEMITMDAIPGIYYIVLVDKERNRSAKTFFIK